MDTDLIALWEKHKDDLAVEFDKWKKYEYISYEGLFKLIVERVFFESTLDPDRITVIDHGDYQGSLLLTIAEKGYQPDTYWVALVYYGSCSGCDTLQAALDEDDETRTKDLMRVALHIVQKLKRI